MNLIILLPLLISLLAGILLAKNKNQEESLGRIALGALLVNFVLSVLVLLTGVGSKLELWSVAGPLRIYFSVDTLGGIIAAVISLVWFLVGIYSLWYMEHSPNRHLFLAFYVWVGGIIPEICYAGNFFTFYIFFELMTIVSAVLVLFEMTPEAIKAAKKYMLYSFAGAFLALFGFFQLTQLGMNLDFSGTETIPIEGSKYYFAVFLVIVGLGTKAGIFPMHGWLPTAHPVAPAPASAVLSGAITKMGVIGVIRFTYFIVGAENLRGTWVQYAWIILSLITILLGSIMAYKEDIIKKRIAYSTVSQVSYVLFGLALFAEDAFTGAVMHMTFHSIIKSALFLMAGVIIHQTGKERVSEIDGIGKKMPITMWAFTLSSVALVGIPPMSPFLSKWYIAIGSLGTGIKVIDWLGPVVLLVSALFTALYLLGISLKVFLGEDRVIECKDPGKKALIPIIVLTVLAIVMGLWPQPLMDVIGQVRATVF